MKMEKKANPCNVLTPKFRVSYPHLFKPQAPKPNDKPKYSVTMLFPKNADLTLIKGAIQAAKIEAYGADKSKWPRVIESPVTDGDDPKNDDKEGYKGHWVIKATTGADYKPQVFDENGQPTLDQSVIYPGCYARAFVFARRWEYMKKEGIHFILDGIQKMSDGKPFGNRKPLDQVFTPVGTGNPIDDEGQDEENF